MNNDYWLDRWKENRIGFHKPVVNPFLERYWPQVAETAGRILAPLCGKSVDLVWLAERGHEVVGIDLSQLAADAFASEQGRRAERVKYLVGDLFDLTAEKVGLFDFVYDRAALIALPEGLRARYVKHLRTLLTPRAQALLISLEYDPAQMTGPPFSVPESEVRSLFAPAAIEKLHEHDCIDEEQQFKARGLSWMKEIVWNLRFGDA